jgi:hypothetical protein
VDGSLVQVHNLVNITTRQVSIFLNAIKDELGDDFNVLGIANELFVVLSWLKSKCVHHFELEFKMLIIMKKAMVLIFIDKNKLLFLTF